MVNGRYEIIYTNSTDSNGTLSDPFSTKGIYAIFLEYNQVNDHEPSTLYQSTMPGSEFTDLDCDVSYVGVGQTCIVTGRFAATKSLYLKVDFLTSGFVHNVENLDAQFDPVIDQY